MIELSSYELSAKMAATKGMAHLEAGQFEEAITEYTNAVQLQYQRIQQVEANARYLYEHYLDDINTSYQQNMQEIEADYQKLSTQILTDFDSSLVSVDSSIKSKQENEFQLSKHPSPLKWIVSAWDNPVWDSYQPYSDTITPTFVRIGHLDLPEQIGFHDLPAMLPFLGQTHLFIHDDNAPNARLLIQSLMLRTIVASPPGSVKLILVDPDGAGSNLSGFLNLNAALRSSKVYSRKEEISIQLEKLLKHIEDVIQTRLQNLYPTVEQYNVQAGGMAVPYQVLTLLDFPAGFDARMIENLFQIARAGLKAGVHIIASLNLSSYPLPHDFDLKNFTALGKEINLSVAGKINLNIPDLGDFPIVPDRLPSSDQVNRLLNDVSGGISTHDLSFESIVIPEKMHWQGNSVDELKIPIGLNSRGEIHYFELGKDTLHHCLLGGMVGSGKSNLLHILITQLALLYPPEEIELYLMDFKEGVEFQDYLSLAHARVVALETEPEFALNVLRLLQSEMERRGQLFKSQRVDNLLRYRLSQDQPLPRILLIIDEFQTLFAEDHLSFETQRIMEDLVKRGRAFGMHVLLSSQSPSTGSLTSGRRIYDQMGLRIALRCRQDDARLILGESNSAADQLQKAGEAIYNTDLGHKEKNIFIQIALLDQPQRQTILKRIRSLAGHKDYQLPITFVTSEQAQIHTNQHLTQAIRQPPKPLGDPTRIWLGEPIEIKEPTSATLERYIRSNLLILGSNETQAHGLITASLVSLVSQRGSQDLRMIIAEFARPSSPFFDLYKNLKEEIPPNIIEIPVLREIGPVLSDLVNELIEREADTKINFQDTYLMIAGLHRWRDLRPEPGKFGAAGISSTAEQLLRLADEGPEFGIHLIAWSDGLSVMNQYFGRKGLGNFDQRVFLRLSDTESAELLGNKSAAILKDNRAIYRYEEWEIGKTEKFKPYPIPESSDLTQLLTLLNSRI